MAESEVPWPSAGKHKTLLVQRAKLCWRPPDGNPAEARGKQVAWGPEPKACCVASIQSHPWQAQPPVEASESFLKPRGGCALPVSPPKQPVQSVLMPLSQQGVGAGGSTRAVLQQLRGGVEEGMSYFRKSEQKPPCYTERV
jgi:hypothetical protein